jgi:hypothetical protein
VPEELVVVLDLPPMRGRRRWWRSRRILHTSANPARHARETQSWQVWRPCTSEGIKAPLRRATMIITEKQMVDEGLADVPMVVNYVTKRQQAQVQSDH